MVIPIAAVRIVLRDGQLMTCGASRFSADNDSYYFHVQVARFPNGEPVTETMRFSKASVVSVDGVCTEVEFESLSQAKRVRASL